MQNRRIPNSFWRTACFTLVLALSFLLIIRTPHASSSLDQWVSLTGHEESGWDWPENAYDDNVNTGAHKEVYGSSWSPWLILTHEPIIATKLRFVSSGSSGSQQEAYVDGVWRPATYEGSSEGFGIYAFDGGLLTKVRIKLFGLGGGYHQLNVYEADILNSTSVPPFVDDCQSTRHFIYQKYGWINVTVHTDYGVDSLETVGINVTTENDAEKFCLAWARSLDSFSELSDVNGICQLDGMGSTMLDLGGDYYEISFYLRILKNATGGYADVTAFLEDKCGYSDVKQYTEKFWTGDFIAEKDTYIGHGEGGGGAHGSETTMKVGYYYPLYHYEGQAQIWLQFNLNSVEKGTTVENASLNLYFIGATYQEMEVRLRGHSNMTWDENEVTWENPPTGSFYENVLGYFRGPDSSGAAGWWQFNDDTTESYEPGYPFGGGPWIGFLDSYINYVLEQDIREATFCLDITGFDGAGGFYVFRTKEWGTPYLSFAACYAPLPPKYALTVASLPTNITFLANETSQETPWLEEYESNTIVGLEMPATYSSGDTRFYWLRWSDGNTSRSRMVTINTNITLIAYYDGPYYEISVDSSPITGIQFTINGTIRTTKYNDWLLEGSYVLVMPETHNGYFWLDWLEDGDPNRTKTVTLPTTTWTGVFVQPYGPEADFKAIPETALPGQSIRFDASTSSPGWNGTHAMSIVEYHWDFGDGNKTVTSNPTTFHSYANPGAYCVNLTVYAPGAKPETDSTIYKVIVFSVPVGGYSYSKVSITLRPLTLYLAVLSVLTLTFVVTRYKISRKR